MWFEYIDVWIQQWKTPFLRSLIHRFNQSCYKAQYAVEVWGTSFVNSPVEKVHSYVKKLLGVFEQTANTMAYGETRRYPLYITCYTRVLKYWFHVLHMNNNQMPKQLYLMLKNLDEQGKVNWASTTKETSRGAGFRFVWEEQLVITRNSWVFFKQRFIDMFRQNWVAKLRGYNRYKL